MRINGKEVDLRGVLPLKVKDWRALRDMGATMDALKALGATKDLDLMVKIVTYVMQKANPEVTEADVDELTLDELSEFLGQSLADDEDVNRPTGSASTSSGGRTDGPRGKLTA